MFSINFDISYEFQSNEKSKLFSIVEDKEINIKGILTLPDKGLVIVKGFSGSGKTSIFREIQKKFKDITQFIKLNNIENYSLTNKIVSILDLYENLDEVKEIMKIGLSDGLTLLTPIENLSVGQKYRLLIYELTKQFFKDNKKKILIIDEFDNYIDNYTLLSVVKYLRRKAIENNKIVIVSFVKDLEFSYFEFDKIYQIFGFNIYDITNKIEKRNLADELRVIQDNKLTKELWIKLFSKFHYLTKDLLYYIRGFIGFINDYPVGVIIYSLPILRVGCRNKLFPEYKNNSELINKDFIRISRFVVLPEFRNLGIGYKLFKESVEGIKEIYPSKNKIELISQLTLFYDFPSKYGFKHKCKIEKSILKNILRYCRDKKDLREIVEDEKCLNYTKGVLKIKATNKKLIKGEKKYFYNYLRILSLDKYYYVYEIDK